MAAPRLWVAQRYAEAMGPTVNPVVVRNYEEAYLAILRRAGHLPDWSRAMWATAPLNFGARWERRSLERAPRFERGFARSRDACVAALQAGPTRAANIRATDPRHAAAKWQQGIRGGGGRFESRWLAAIRRPA